MCRWSPRCYPYLIPWEMGKRQTQSPIPHVCALAYHEDKHILGPQPVLQPRSQEPRAACLHRAKLSADLQREVPPSRPPRVAETTSGAC